MTEQQIKDLVDATFGALELALKGRPFLLLAVSSLHAIADTPAVLGSIASLFAAKQAAAK